MNREEDVITIIKNNLETPCEVTLESKLIDDLNIDSFSLIMIVNEFEDEFSITINEKDFNELQTVKDIIAKLNNKYFYK